MNIRRNAMAYSIQELILLQEGSNSRPYYKSDSANDQSTRIKILSTTYPASHQPIRYNSEYEYTDRAFRPKRMVAVAHGAGRVWIIQGGMP